MPYLRAMIETARPDRPARPAWRRIAMLAGGWLLLIVTPLVAPLPGPGGVFTFAGGLSLLLRASPWVQRRYVRFKAWAPRGGAWCDWALRRASAKRRKARAQALAATRPR